MTRIAKRLGGAFLLVLFGGLMLAVLWHGWAWLALWAVS
jgi:hypothetical protein